MEAGLSGWTASELSIYLLPLFAAARASALEEAARDWSNRSRSAEYGNDEIGDFLRDRAAALRRGAS